MNIMLWVIVAFMILLASGFLLKSLMGDSSISRNRRIRFSLVPTLLSAALAVGLYAYFGNRDAAVADRPLSASTQSAATPVTRVTAQRPSGPTDGKARPSNSRNA